MYLTKLVPIESTRAVFKARRTDTGKLLVIKFTEEYDCKAHSLLARQKLAPALLYYPGIEFGSSEGIFCGLKMIVAEYIVGETARYAPQQLAAAFEDVEKAIQVLHANGLVSGDLREPDIMIEKTTGRTLLVDFDWCAKEGEGRRWYDWHPSVSRGGAMEMQHDLYRLSKLRR
jgi:hypothetical protein